MFASSDKMSMKAVCYKGPFSVEVQDVVTPSIEHPDDIIVKVTTSAICGSDLHMYEGRTGAEPGEYYISSSSQPMHLVFSFPYQNIYVIIN